MRHPDAKVVHIEFSPLPAEDGEPCIEVEDLELVWGTLDKIVEDHLVNTGNEFGLYKLRKIDRTKH